MKKQDLIYIYVTAACCLLACATIGVPNAYGLFYEPLSAILDTGKANATLHVSIAGLVTGFSSPLIIKILKKVHYRFIIIAGIGLLTLSGYVIANTRSLLLVNIMGVLRGLGLACSSNVIITLLTGNWFKARRGTISGLIMSFSGIMGSILTPLVATLLERHGFRFAYLFCAIAILVLAFPAMTLPLRPEDIDMKPYGEDFASISGKDSYEGRYELSFFNKVFLLLVTTSFLVICVTTLTSYLPSYVQSLGQSAKNAASLLSASMVGNVLFKFLIGISIDKKGVLFSFIVFMSIAFVGLVFITFFPINGAVLYISGVLYGACYAVNKVAIPLIVRIFYGDEKYGEAYSTLSLCENIARSSIITAIGFMYDNSGTYLYCFLIALFACVASSLLMLYQQKKR